jgi:saccharopine dehydrogenase-like NADP-dependent oxidoreductase
LKAEAGSKKTAAIRVDVNDQKALMKATEDTDVVANFVGPYYLYGVKVIEAAIEAKADYVDINDDYDATRDVLALHKAAKNAGITAVTGMGASPGQFGLAGDKPMDL